MSVIFSRKKGARGESTGRVLGGLFTNSHGRASHGPLPDGEQLFFRDRLNKVIVVVVVVVVVAVVAEALDDVAYCQHTQKTCKCRQVANHQSSALSSNPGDDSVHRSVISSWLFSIFYFILFFVHFIDCLDRMNLETNEIGLFNFSYCSRIFHGGKKCS